MALKKHKISFCIICMNRLHQLKETLLINIEDNQDYDELEFIVLDYNSQDGMEQWIKDNMSKFIESGKVIYYRTPDPDSFSHSHSKNLAFKLATGDIVCNINADNYTGFRFANYINELYNIDDNIMLTPLDHFKKKKDFSPPPDVMGKVCVKRVDFLKVKGFDERMINYGSEDRDFANRIEMAGVKRVLIEDFAFLKFIPHDNEERFSTKKTINNIHAVYSNYSTPNLSNVIFLYKDSQFQMGTLIDNSTNYANNYAYAFKERDYTFEFSQKEVELGVWEESIDQDNITLSFNSGSNIYLKKNIINSYTTLNNEDNGFIFHQITNPEIIKSMVFFNRILSNRAIMEQNLNEKRIEVNSGNFGKALVFKNFDSNLPIRI